MLSKLTRKAPSISLKYIVFYLLSFSVSFGSSFQKVFNIQNQDKIKDLSFEIEFSDLKKKLEPLYPMKNLDKFKIMVYWANDGSFDILLSSFPRGKKTVENSLKLH